MLDYEVLVVNIRKKSIKGWCMPFSDSDHQGTSLNQHNLSNGGSGHLWSTPFVAALIQVEGTYLKVLLNTLSNLIPPILLATLFQLASVTKSDSKNCTSTKLYLFQRLGQQVGGRSTTSMFIRRDIACMTCTSLAKKEGCFVDNYFS